MVAEPATVRSPPRRGRAEDLSLLDRRALVFLALAAVVTALNAVFHLVLSRELGPSQYGALGSLLALVLLASLPLGALQLTVARAATAAPHSSISAAVVRWRRFGLVAAGIAIAVSPLSFFALRLSSPIEPLLLALFMAPAVAGVVPRGILLAHGAFDRLGWSLAVGTVVKLAVSLPLALVLGVTGAIIGVVLGELVTTSLSMIWLPRSPRGDAALVIEPRQAWLSGVAVMGFWSMVGVDTLLARLLLDDSSSGLYTAASTLARAPLFLPAALAVVSFRRFASGNLEDSHQARTLHHALLLTTLLAVTAAVALCAAPGFWVSLLFGDQYDGSSAVVAILSAASICFAVAQILVHFHLAHRSRVALVPWCGVIVTTVSVVAVHTSGSTVALGVFIGALVAATFLLVPAVVRTRPLTRIESTGSDVMVTEANPDFEVAVVVPYYNPGSAVVDTLMAVEAALAATGVPYEVIAVSDGSNDGSVRLVEAVVSKHIRSIVLPENCGKGYAVQVGIAGSRAKYVGFIDADGDIDPSQLRVSLAVMTLYQPDVVLASKRHPMSRVEYPPLRRLYSWCFQQFVRVLFRLEIRDTQTGLKLLRRDVLVDVLPLARERRFAFDLEVFVLAQMLGYRRFFEVPVVIQHQFRSTISARAVRTMVADTFSIFYRLRISHAYDRVHRRVLAGARR